MMGFIKWWWRRYNIASEIVTIAFILIFFGGLMAIYYGFAKLEMHLFNTAWLVLLPILFIYLSIFVWYPASIAWGVVSQYRRDAKRESDG